MLQLNSIILKYSLFVFIFILAGLVTQTKGAINPDYDSRCSVWADSVFQSLTPEERIGQLFMVHAYSNWDKKNINYIESLLRKNNIGGVIFFQGGPGRHLDLRNRIVNATKTPMWFGIDGEWGPSMRLDSLISFPRQMTLGAIQDNQLLYEFGQALGEQCELLGVNINFAPVLDLNSNPENPVINSRSLGETADFVTPKAYMISKGLQSKTVMAVGKHFPGHGNTDKDSHYDLPLIKSSYPELRDNEIVPFKEMIQRGIWGMMIGHLQVPSLDTELPASLSPKVINGLLRDSLGFEGIVFTDALNMKAVAGKVDKHYTKAFLAGNDVLLFPVKIQSAVQEIIKAVEDSIISSVAIEQRVKKILRYKYMLGVNSSPKDKKTSLKAFEDPKYDDLNERLIKASVTTIVNRDAILPINQIDNKKVAIVSFGSESDTTFINTMRKYGDFPSFTMPSKGELTGVDYKEALAKADVVIAAVFGDVGNVSQNYGVSSKVKDEIVKLATNHKVILAYMGNPFALRSWDAIFPMLQGIQVVYQSSSIYQDVLAQAIVGGIETTGKLSLSIGKTYKPGMGIYTPKTRLAYTNPLHIVKNAAFLDNIDAIINDAIEKKATPGAQILVAKSGNIIYHKSFGNKTYDEAEPVRNSDIYDIASVTKIVSTLPQFMKLNEEGKVKIGNKLGDLLPDLVGSNKESIRLDNMLRHEARLPSFIPFQLFTFDPATYEKFYSRKQDDTFSIKADEWYYANRLAKPYHWLFSAREDMLHQLKVTDNMYMHEAFVDTIYKHLRKVPLLVNKGYRYSDLAFYFLQQIVEKQSGKRIDLVSSGNLFNPLGMDHTCFNPVDHGIPVSDIVPTENDMIFRKTQIRGTVHDQGASLLGGVAGHAGVFSNSNDLAKLMQMYLNGGSYGGTQYLTNTTIDYFTQNLEDGNRRALGFDKPELDTSKVGPTCNEASPFSFGHTGFTGTMVWVDPKYELIYIFLSNRIYPNAWNKKLLEMDVRTRIQQVIYQSITNE